MMILDSGLLSLGHPVYLLLVDSVSGPKSDQCPTLSKVTVTNISDTKVDILLPVLCKMFYLITIVCLSATV